MKAIASNPKAAALVGLLFAFPLLVTNAVVANRIEPFFSRLRPVAHTGIVEYLVLAIILLLLPVGAWIAVRPVFNTSARGPGKYWLLNIAVAVALLAMFVAMFVGIGSEVYRCDVLRISNCD